MPSLAKLNLAGRSEFNRVLPFRGAPWPGGTSTKVAPMAKSAAALCKPPSSVTSTVASVTAPFTAAKADLRPKSGSMGLKN